MKLTRQNFQSSIPWFTLGMLAVLVLSLVLHFWELGRFNTLVFDEVYYVKYANNYLTDKPLFDAHPPLGKYMIAVGMWLGSKVLGKDLASLASTDIYPWIYRWFNALTGSLLPLVVGGIAYQLSQRRSFTLIASLFMAVDGLFLVESRYALINIYLVMFGLLGQLCFLFALRNQGIRRQFWLIIAGVCFGASVAVKWNGLGFLLGIYFLWVFAWFLRLLSRNRTTERFQSPGIQKRESILQNITKINLGQIIFYLGVIPAIIYYLVWIPHLQINTDMNFVQVHQQMLGFHQTMKTGPKVHPYCSSWYGWPLVIRPVVYLYEKAVTSSKAAALPPVPEGMKDAVFTVYGMGNPFLWWLSTFAMLLLINLLFRRVWVGLNTFNNSPEVQIQQSRNIPNIDYFPTSKEFWLICYIIVNWAVHFLPWIKVTRCTFMYLYMSAAVFAFMGLAWLADRWLQSYQIRLKFMGLTTIFLVVAAFVFWLPIYLGLPLTSQEYQLRIWLSTWI